MTLPVLCTSQDTAPYIVANNNNIEVVSSAFNKLFGFEVDKLIGKNINTLFDIPKNTDNLTTRLLKLNVPTKWGVTKTILTLEAEIGQDKKIFFFKENYSFYELSLFHDKCIDRLTGLQLRYAFNKTLNKEVDFYTGTIRIKDFASVPAYLGEDFADTLLVEVARNLKQHFSSSDIYTLRQGVFAVIKSKNSFETLFDFSNYIITNVNKFNFSNNESMKKSMPSLAFSFSFAESDGAEVFKKSMVALNIARDKNEDVFFLKDDLQDTLRSDFEHKAIVLEKLKDALANNRIIPYYQPIRNNVTGKINKFECLARLEDENGEILSPFYFIDISKIYNLESEITKAIVKKSFENFRNKDIDFSINLSLQSLNSNTMFYFLVEAVQQFPNPHNVIFEIVESESMPLELFEKNPLINELRKYGCRFALDDFGTGYSNLSMLSFFKYDYLKIDGSLITNIHKDNIYNTVKLITEIAHNNNIEVIAEWVKDEDIQARLLELNVDYSQGYLFGMPREHSKSND